MFDLTPEQQQLKESVARFFGDKSPEAAVRKLLDDELGLDPLVWKAMASQMGLQSILIPERYGKGAVIALPPMDEREPGALKA